MTILRLPGKDAERGEAMVCEATCTLELLEVEPGYKYQGRGARLLKLAEDHLRDCNCQSISLICTNGSRGFYRKQGYERIGFMYSKYRLWKPLTTVDAGGGRRVGARWTRAAAAAWGALVGAESPHHES